MKNKGSDIMVNINARLIEKVIKELKDNYNYKEYRIITNSVLLDILAIFENELEYTNSEIYEIIEEYFLENIVMEWW